MDVSDGLPQDQFENFFVLFGEKAFPVHQIMGMKDSQGGPLRFARQDLGDIRQLDQRILIVLSVGFIVAVGDEKKNP